ncbi:MAG: nucleotidyltransferase domain-containing protein [Cyanobacteriota bacterium]|nr:nucleotidyltransferase domain-containing protein [Cyanobacteriota bacterium]
MKSSKASTDSLHEIANFTDVAIDLPRKKIAEFCDRWSIVEFSLFGSVLRDDFRSESDIDVMVQFYTEAHPTLFDLAQMEEELKVMFQRDVDLVTRKGIETSRNYLRRNTILSSTRTIYGTRSAIAARSPAIRTNYYGLNR